MSAHPGTPTTDFTCGSSGRNESTPISTECISTSSEIRLAQRPLHRQLDPRVLPTELIQQRQKIKTRVLIRRQVQLSPMQLPQLSQSTPPPRPADLAAWPHTPAKTSPASVSVPSRELRSNSTSPSSCSSFAIA